MSSKTGRIISVLITLFWLATISILVTRNYNWGDGASHHGASPPRHMFEPQWMGIYQADRKIGHSMTLFNSVDGGYSLRESVSMHLGVMGQDKSLGMDTQALLDAHFLLRSFDFTMDSDVKMKISGEVKDNTLHIVIASASGKEERDIKLKERPYMGLPSVSALTDELKVGSKIAMPVLDPGTLTQGAVEFEVIGEETVQAMGQSMRALKLAGTMVGMDVTAWVTTEGEVLREESMGYVFVREPEAMAKSGIVGPSDLITDNAVPFDLPIKSGVTFLKLRISGVDMQGLALDGGSQRLDGDVLTIRKPNLPNLPIYEATGGADYLQDELFIESRDPRIVKLAGQITRGERDHVKKARMINDWVYRNINKKMTLSVPRATDVLMDRQGDCNEHTVLYVALARAAGVPSRIIVGLVHKDGYFYYHAWPEVYLNSWIPADPTFGQFPADASHIRLLTGGLDQQATLLRVIKKIRLEGIEAR